jgi:branched-chain amino acid transport system substrate-binding protein
LNDEVVFGRYFHAGEFLEFHHRRHDVAAGGDLDVVALQVQVGDLERVAGARLGAMEGMSFESPKGRMTFRKEDHQAMQSMYHFKIKSDPAFAWGVPELVREIKAEEMDVPIKNKR